MESAFREKRFHGTQQFPCAFYIASPNCENGVFEVAHHWHDEIEIMFLQQGSFLLEINMEQYQLQSPCICVINSGELHALTTVSPKYLQTAVVFQPYLLAFQEEDRLQKQIIEALCEKRLQMPRLITPENHLWQALANEYQCMQDAFLREQKINHDQLLAESSLSQLFIKASLLKMLAFFKQEDLLIRSEQQEDVKVSYMKVALSYIHEHYKEKIYIRNLADVAGLNEQYFCRLFRQVIGMSPVEYMNSYRLRKAAVLLEDSDLSVTEVAYECGFHDMGGFIRGFRRLMGTTPLQYRKALYK